VAGKTIAEDTVAPSTYPGERFGLPEHGPMSVAPMMRRFGALLADWLLCLLIATGLFHSGGWTIVVFSVEVYLLTAISGLTVGKRLFGIRAVRTSGERIGFGWAALRVLLLLTVVPPLLTDRDLRGLHDRAADTIVVRLLSRSLTGISWLVRALAACRPPAFSPSRAPVRRRAPGLPGGAGLPGRRRVPAMGGMPGSPAVRPEA
jgi:uncharacterized RDD family membrane protein YckC